MGIDLTTLLAGLTGGAQGMSSAVQQDEARKRQLALDAMNMAAHQATMAKIKADAAHQQQDDYLKGVRQGVAPDGSAINGALNIASGMAGANLPGGASLTAPLAVAQARQENPDQYAPDRFQQINGQSYIDRTATPEAIQERARVAADRVRERLQTAHEDRADQRAAASADRLDQRSAARTAALAQKPDPVQLVTGTGPDGLPTYGEYDKATHTIRPLQGSMVPKQSGSGGASGSQAPVGDMQARYNEIENAAREIAAGQWHPTMGMQSREAVTYGIANANAGGHPSVTAPLVAGAMDLFGIGGKGTDGFAKYQALMNSTRAFGDDAAKVFKGRQNEDAVKREIALAQLTPDDYNNPTVVAQKLSRLRHVIELAHMTMPTQPGAAAPQPAQPTAPTSGRRRNIFLDGPE